MSRDAALRFDPPEWFRGRHADRSDDWIREEWASTVCSAVQGGYSPKTHAYWRALVRANTEE